MESPALLELVEKRLAKRGRFLATNWFVEVPAMLMRIWLVPAALLLLALSDGTAQTWLRTYGTSGNNSGYGFSVVLAGNGMSSSSGRPAASRRMICGS